MKIKKTAKKIWNFLVHDESLASFIADAIIIILLGRFVIYPILGLAFGTAFPVVAVVSSSMDHESLDFDAWWAENSEEYEEFEITKLEFESFYRKNGFNKGDIFVAKGVPFEELQVGDIAIYRIAEQRDPIIHRIVLIEEDTIQTKGDANPIQLHFEKSISEEQIQGKAIARIPYLGWLKVLLVETINLFR